MKLQIGLDQKYAFQKCCIELGFECQFHELGTPIGHDGPLINAYVRDNQLGELNNKLAFYLGMAFRGELQEQIYKEIGR